METAPFHFNNFIYKIDLKEPLHEGSFNAVLPEGRRRPSVFITAPPPPSAGVKTVVFRLSNPLASGVNSTHRIENEVASLFLARQALAARSSSGELPPEYASIVPAVYAWSRRVEVDAPGNTKTITVSGGNDGSTNENASESVATPSAAVAAAATDDRPDERTFAWLIMEYRPGEPLDRHFGALPLADRVCIVRDVASVVAVLQHIGIPKTVREFGGINITADHYESTTAGDGNARLDMPFLASGQMAILPNCGPFATLAELWQARLRCKLAEADKSPVLAGWVANGVRQRVEALIANGVPELLRRGLVNTERRVLVHGDLCKSPLSFQRATEARAACLWPAPHDSKHRRSACSQPLIQRGPTPYSLSLSLRSRLLVPNRKDISADN